MARLTIEDCKPFVSNRFELVILAATRSRDIISGAPISVDRDGDKTSVISLREIAQQSIDLDSVKEQSIRQFQNARHQVDFDRDSSKKDDFISETENDSLISPQFAALEQETLESGFDSVSEILDDDLLAETDGFETSPATDSNTEGNS